MQVNFYATFRPLVGSKTIEFDLPASTTPFQLLKAVISRYPSLADQLLNENGELFADVHLFINGRDVLYLPQGLDTPLTCQDKIDIFPPVGGGAAQKSLLALFIRGERYEFNQNHHSLG